ncbi:uroporphyrinogen-III synthase [Halalkalibacillus halophilus]|uniref:uroporphyrinogen-III synthase n=1 Tax=Halalkalibacillus halophilus TaxID=392827 RepID=UPI0003FAE3F4|nr:uroporphyrinogen-III synthase [Halalkalibacillus halophilus]
MTAVAGKEILLSREPENATPFTRKLEEVKANVHCIGLIEFQDCFSYTHLLNTPLHSVDWLFFTSMNGVRFFFDQVKNDAQMMEFLTTIQIAAVGPKTKAAVKDYGFEVDFIPSVYDADHLADEFLQKFEPNHIVIVKGNLSRNILDNYFKTMQVPYTPLIVYETKVAEGKKVQLDELTKNYQLDALVFTSPSNIDAWLKMSSKSTSYLNLPCFCIGETTEKKARESGFSTIIKPERYTLEELANSVIAYYERSI